MDELIPMAKWGKDHWSTLSYIETVMLNNGGYFRMKGDPRMRSNRRHYRLMPTPNGIPMRPEHGTRLFDETIVEGHDDWCCLQDFAAEGLLDIRQEELDIGEKFKLSEKGLIVANKLRDHKMQGKSFGTFRAGVT